MSFSMHASIRCSILRRARINFKTMNKCMYFYRSIFFTGLKPLAACGRFLKVF